MKLITIFEKHQKCQIYSRIYFHFLNTCDHPKFINGLMLISHSFSVMSFVYYSVIGFFFSSVMAFVLLTYELKCPCCIILSSFTLLTTGTNSNIIILCISLKRVTQINPDLLQICIFRFGAT